jgi:mannose-6-phosphate isomerase-like protein (cupin superfamily)
MRFSIYMILPGHENPLHRHPGSDEILFFSNGTGECIIGDKTWPVKNGVVLFVPNTTTTLRN